MYTIEISELGVAELDTISGGGVAGHKHCQNGAKAGGASGLYTLYVECNPAPGYGAGDLGKDMWPLFLWA